MQVFYFILLVRRALVDSLKFPEHVRRRVAYTEQWDGVSVKKSSVFAKYC